MMTNRPHTVALRHPQTGVTVTVGNPIFRDLPGTTSYPLGGHDGWLEI